MRAFNGDLTYKSLMETYNECCFGMLHPVEIRVGPETYEKVRKVYEKETGTREFGIQVFHFMDARFVRVEHGMPEDVLHYYVPSNDSKYGAILCLKGPHDGSTVEVM